MSEGWNSFLIGSQQDVDDAAVDEVDDVDHEQQAEHVAAVAVADRELGAGRPRGSGAGNRRAARRLGHKVLRGATRVGVIASIGYPGAPSCASSKKSGPNGFWPRIGIEPRRIVQSLRRELAGAREVALGRLACAPAGGDARRARAPRARAASPRVGSGWWRRTSSGVERAAALAHPRAQRVEVRRRRACRGTAVKVSVPNCASCGRTMRPPRRSRSSVGTLTT